MQLKPAPFVGREREMAHLEQTLDQLLGETKEDEGSDDDSSSHVDYGEQCPKVLSIVGAPGSGKSTLAQQLRTRVLESSGYFIRGKFDENSAASPYSGLAMAMEDFADQIIERDWDMGIRRKLREFLQGNETILLDVFSGLDKIILNMDEAEDDQDDDDDNNNHSNPDLLQERPDGYPYNKPQSEPDTPQTSYSSQALEDINTGKETIKNNLRSDREEGAQRSKRRVFFFQQFFHAVLSPKKYQDEDIEEHQDAVHKNTEGDKKEPCIVMVLDDVQWADKASLDLISSLVRDPDLGSFLLLATSRPITDSKHLLRQQLKSWRKEGVVIKDYPLDNLCISSVESIVAHCLDCNGDTISHILEDSENSRITFPLAQIIHQRTQGNPFFAVEFLKALIDRQVLTFSYATMQWKWDIDKVHSLVLTMTDSPVDLLISKTKRLPPSQQLILLISSCLGGTFKAKLIRKVLKSLFLANRHDKNNPTNDNKPLALLTKHATKDLPVLDTLEGFVYNGFLDRSGPSFFFVHDLIRQAAMEFVSPQEIQWMKLRVGECILQGMRRALQEKLEPSHDGSTKGEANLSLGVDLCNSAAHLIQDTADQAEQKPTNLTLVDLARFNCRAGEKAMCESAFLEAVKYLKTGMHLMQRTNNEDRDEALMAKLVSLAAEASYCSGNYEDMNTYAEQVLSDSNCTEDMRVRMQLFKVQSAAAQDFAAEALDIGYAGLQLLGMATFPRYPKPYHVVIELLKTKKALRNHNMETLCVLPIVSDTRRQAAMEFVNAMKGSAAVSNQDFLIVTFLKSIRWSVKYGVGKHSPGGFSIYGTILNAMFGETKNAIMYGEVALALADRMGLQETTAETSTLTFGMLRHWTSDMRSCHAPLVYAQKLAAECGDIETVTYCLIFGSCVLWCTAMISLPGMGQHLQRSCALCRDFKHWSMLEILTNLGMHLRKLRYDDVNDNSFDWLDVIDCEASSHRGSTCSDSAAKQQPPSKDPTIELFYECMALQSHFLLDERTEALKCAKLTSTMGTELCIGQSYVPRTQFYRALVYLVPPSKGNISRKHMREARRALALLKRWANNGNPNCIHKVRLVEAEFARVKKRNSEARELYIGAIRAAELSGHIQDAATGHECAAVFFLRNINDQARAAIHIGQAIRLYTAWGATAVVQRIKQTYGDIRGCSSAAACYEWR